MPGLRVQRAVKPMFPPGQGAIFRLQHVRLNRSLRGAFRKIAMRMKSLLRHASASKDVLRLDCPMLRKHSTRMRSRGRALLVLAMQGQHPSHLYNQKGPHCRHLLARGLLRLVP